MLAYFTTLLPPPPPPCIQCQYCPPAPLSPFARCPTAVCDTPDHWAGSIPLPLPCPCIAPYPLPSLLIITEWNAAPILRQCAACLWHAICGTARYLPVDQNCNITGDLGPPVPIVATIESFGSLFYASITPDNPALCRISNPELTGLVVRDPTFQCTGPFTIDMFETCTSLVPSPPYEWGPATFVACG